jgi:predicted TIM-barrel fold metal-dependent hydrolase
MEKPKWLDTHVHVSDIGADGKSRPNLLHDLLAVLDNCDADLRWVISVDGHWLSKTGNDPEGANRANSFIRELVQKAPGRLYGSCMVNPRFLDASLKIMEKAFTEWGFVQLGEMLQYMMNYRMNSDPVEKIVRLAVELGVPVQVHISTSNSKQGNFSSGVEELLDLFGLAARVPEAKYILAHGVGMKNDNPPVVDRYLDEIEKEFGRWPDNFWLEIRDFDSPGVRSALARVPSTRIIAGTDWCSRIDPPFLPYGIIFGIKSPEENPYPPCVASMKSFLRKCGASESVISQIGFENAAKLLRFQDRS